MNLWTPDGEIPIDRSRGGERARGDARAGERGVSGASGAPGTTGASGVADGPSLEDLSPEERAQADAVIEQMAQVQAEIARTPAAQLVANHVMGLYELAAIKLGQQPPQFTDAQLAIDAMAAVLDTVGPRLGEDRQPLTQGLGQLQMAFVQLKQRAEGDGGDGAPGV